MEKVEFEPDRVESNGSSFDDGRLLNFCAATCARKCFVFFFGLVGGPGRPPGFIFARTRHHTSTPAPAITDRLQRLLRLKNEMRWDSDKVKGLSCDDDDLTRGFALAIPSCDR